MTRYLIVLAALVLATPIARAQSAADWSATFAGPGLLPLLEKAGTVGVVATELSALPAAEGLCAAMLDAEVVGSCEASGPEHAAEAATESRQGRLDRLVLVSPLDEGRMDLSVHGDTMKFVGTGEARLGIGVFAHVHRPVRLRPTGERDPDFVAIGCESHADLKRGLTIGGGVGIGVGSMLTMLGLANSLVGLVDSVRGESSGPDSSAEVMGVAGLVVMTASSAALVTGIVLPEESGDGCVGR